MRTTVQNARPWGSAVATFLTCLVLGPPIGGLVFSFAMLLIPDVAGIPRSQGTGFGDYLLMVVWVSLFAVPFSYVIGGLQAAATGFAFGAYGWFKRKLPFWFAVITALCVYLASAIAGFSDGENLLAIMLPVHIIPAFLCWLIVRTYWKTT